MITLIRAHNLLKIAMVTDGIFDGWVLSAS